MAKNHGKNHQAGGFSSQELESWVIYGPRAKLLLDQLKTLKARVFRIQARWEFLTGFENGPDWAVGGMINSDIS